MNRRSRITPLLFAALAAGLALVGAATVSVPPASASPYIRYGIQDDAWLAFGPGGTFDDRLDLLDTLGVDIVRFTLRWDRIASTRPAYARDAADPAYEWGAADALLRGLHARGITVVVTLTGSPRWANGGRSPNWIPRSKWSLAAFAHAAAKRYPFVRHWTIWNEPNQRSQLRPTSARAYVQTLLNPAYAAIKAANPRALVAGGVTAPRGNTGGLSPLDWISAMGAANARLDAYAHNPYPLQPHRETPFSGGCGHCATATMATLERLIGAVRRHLGPKRIWLTEYGYQTNPPDPWLGVSPALQARYVGEAGLRVWKAPYVDMLIHFMLRDDVVDAQFETGYWQSGLMTTKLVRKPSFYAYMLPLAQLSRRGLRTVVWGQVRPRDGAQPYVLQRFANGRWVSVGTRRITGRRGMFLRTIRAGAGASLRIWSPRDRTSSPTLRIR